MDAQIDRFMHIIQTSVFYFIVKAIQREYKYSHGSQVTHTYSGSLNLTLLV